MSTTWNRCKRKRDRKVPKNERMYAQLPEDHEMHAPGVAGVANCTEPMQRMRQQVFVPREMGTGVRSDPIDLSGTQPIPIALESKYERHADKTGPYRCWHRISETRGLDVLFTRTKKTQAISADVSLLSRLSDRLSGLLCRNEHPGMSFEHVH